MKIFLTCVAATMLSVSAWAADVVKVTVQNPLGHDRTQEMVEVDAAKVHKQLHTDMQLVVTDADGREIPSQLTWNGRLIFQPAVGAKAKSVYYIKAGHPQAYQSRVYGRQYPERVDDLAWENDLVAYRTYGPALQKSGERAWGYDIWNKRTDRLILEERYSLELDPEVANVSRKLRKMGREPLAQELYYAVSYHVDHGNGMDCYKVGPTLGGGTTAVLSQSGDEIQYPHCYVAYEILDRGPLRFTVRLTYAKETVGGHPYTETRLISLDAGSHMNRCIVSYEGLPANWPIATGIIIHNENPSAYVLNAKAGYMGYEDLGDVNQYREAWRERLNKDFGKTYVGTVCTTQPATMEFRSGEGLPGAIGHILSLTKYQPKTDYTYYFGTAWSRNPSTNFQDLAAWEAYLSRFTEQVRKPLKVSF
ncbi:MAG: DUF4861 domain-containing protein [Bacteroidaceae bacterium]|nr:DUF4861 domain-containing protein [Bacteroidaceae bacterium]